jgi:hypothetical protein
VNEDNPERDVNVTYSGDIWLTLKPAQGPDDIPVIDQLHLVATESIVRGDGKVYRTPLNMPGLTFVVKTSDKPCRPEEEAR